MSNSIKFSILVPVYKAEHYIDECIISILNQTYPNFELILVDDGSPDRSGEICEEYGKKDRRVRVFHKPNGGSFETRCYAVEQAQGDYYIFVDSDDYIALNTLEVLAKNIEKHHADCIIFGIAWAKPGRTEFMLCHEAYTDRLITDKAEALNIVLNDPSYNSLCRKCTKSSCFDGRDFSPYFHIRRGEDRLHSGEILENAESFLFLPDTFYYYRVNVGSVTHTINFNGYKADFTVGEHSLAMVEKLGVFSQADYNRLRNFEIDDLVAEFKRLSRFCSDKANSIMGLESIWQSNYYQGFLKPGYKKTPALPGIVESRGLRRFMNRIAIFLFKHRLFSLLVLYNKYIFK